MTTTPELGAHPAEALEAPRAPYGRSPSIRPALVVLACAAVVSFGAFATSFIGSGQPAPPTVTGLATSVPGVSLSAVGATPVLKRITSGGFPPKDVLAALVVPKGARIISTTAEDAGVDQYDRSIYLEIDTTSKELLSFYKVELKRAHWSILGTYPVPSGHEILGRLAGSDGYEWEVGVVITPVSPGDISPSLAGSGQTSPPMGLRLRIFIPDDGS